MARNQVQFQKGLSEARFAEICQYRLVFHVADYFRKIGAHLPDAPFIDGVSAEFAIYEAKEHYHVPLLCSPWSYTTYRGS